MKNLFEMITQNSDHYEIRYSIAWGLPTDLSPQSAGIRERYIYCKVSDRYGIPDARKQLLGQ